MVFKENEDSVFSEDMNVSRKPRGVQREDVRADEEPAAVLPQTLYRRKQTDADSVLVVCIPSLTMNLAAFCFLVVALLNCICLALPSVVSLQPYWPVTAAERTFARESHIVRKCQSMNRRHVLSFQNAWCLYASLSEETLPLQNSAKFIRNYADKTKVKSLTWLNSG